MPHLDSKQMPSIPVQCPQCGQRIDALMAAVDKGVTCNRCQATFQPTPTMTAGAGKGRVPKTPQPAAPLPSPVPTMTKPSSSPKPSIWKSLPLAATVFIVSVAGLAILPLSVEIEGRSPAAVALVVLLVTSVLGFFWLYSAADHAVANLKADAEPPRTPAAVAGYILLGVVHYILITTLPLFVTAALAVQLALKLSGSARENPLGETLLASLALAGLLGAAEGFRDGPKVLRMVVITIGRIMGLFDNGSKSKVEETWTPKHYLPHRWGTALSGWVGVVGGILLGIPLVLVMMYAAAMDPNRQTGELLIVPLFTGLFGGACAGFLFGYAYGMVGGAVWRLVGGKTAPYVEDVSKAAEASQQQQK